MKSEIKLYRVVLNVLFYIFYVLLASIAFSFIFPSILVLLGQEVLDPMNPIFDTIQILILVLVLLFSLVFRRFFYLPIRQKVIEVKIEENISYTKEKAKKIKTEKKEKIKEEDDSSELDIKIGKEIK